LAASLLNLAQDLSQPGEMAFVEAHRLFEVIVPFEQVPDPDSVDLRPGPSFHRRYGLSNGNPSATIFSQKES
jgi:hypothetical protein